MHIHTMETVINREIKKLYIYLSCRRKYNTHELASCLNCVRSLQIIIIYRPTKIQNNKEHLGYSVSLHYL